MFDGEKIRSHTQFKSKYSNLGENYQQVLGIVKWTSLSQRDEPRFKSSLVEISIFSAQSCLEQECFQWRRSMETKKN